MKSTEQVSDLLMWLRTLVLFEATVHPLRHQTDLANKAHHKLQGMLSDMTAIILTIDIWRSDFCLMSMLSLTVQLIEQSGNELSFISLQ